MNRRFFLRCLGGLASACVAGPWISLPAEEERGPEPPYVKHGELYIVNPEWRDAPYELAFYINGGTFPHGMGETIRGPIPMRFKHEEDAVRFIRARNDVLKQNLNRILVVDRERGDC